MTKTKSHKKTWCDSNKHTHYYILYTKCDSNKHTFVLYFMYKYTQLYQHIAEKSWKIFIYSCMYDNFYIRIWQLLCSYIYIYKCYDHVWQLLYLCLTIVIILGWQLLILGWQLLHSYMTILLSCIHGFTPPASVPYNQALKNRLHYVSYLAPKTPLALPVDFGATTSSCPTFYRFLQN